MAKFYTCIEMKTCRKIPTYTVYMYNMLASTFTEHYN